VAPGVLDQHFQRDLNHWGDICGGRTKCGGGVHFQHLNLVNENCPFAEPFDHIFCRNVKIYFDRPSQKTLMRLPAEQWVPGGHGFYLKNV
jgi:chemotaxis methyl-accepting protein methylase